jgi:O-antigen/teichoic acid export membrane protein
MGKFNLSKLRNKHFLALAGNGVISVFGIGTMSLLYHSLSKQDVGKWFFFLTILSLLDAIRNGFLGTATVKFYAGTDEQRSKVVLGSVWFLACALTAAAMLLNGLAMLGLSYAHSEELVLAIKWVGITFLSTLPFSVIFWKLQADEQYGKILLLRLVNSGSTILVFAILMLAHQMTLERALLYNFLTNCLTSTVGVLFRLGKVQTLFSSTRTTITELVHYGKYSLATTLSANLLRSTDSFIVTYMLGPAALAIYNLPVRLMEIIEIPLRSFVGTGMSAMAIAYNNNNMKEVTKLLKKYAGMLSLALIPVSIGAALFADLAINILGGSKYFGTEAANLYRLFMAFAFMSPLDRFFGVTLDIIHQPKVNFYKVLLMLVVNIAADFAGIAAFGSIYGVALSSFMVTFTGVYFGYSNLRRYISFTIPEIYRSGYAELKILYVKFSKRQAVEI